MDVTHGSSGDQDLAAAIRDLRKRVGSHDKLAAKLGTTRQTVIRWEQGAFPTRFVSELEAEGIARELLFQPSRHDRRATLEEAVDAQQQELDSAHQAIQTLLQRVEVLEAQVATLRRSRRAAPAKRPGGS